MLYQNDTDAGFPTVAEALRLYTVKEENIALLPQFLDLETPRDLTILDRADRQSFSNYGRAAGQLRKAFIREIVGKKSDELLIRWFLYLDAVAGATAVHLTVSGGGYADVLGNDRFEDILMQALTARYGDDAEAVRLAQNVTFRSWRYFNYAFRGFKAPDTALALRAVNYVDGYGERLTLTIFALGGLTPPKSGVLGGLLAKKDPLVARTLELLAEASAGNKAHPEYGTLLTIAYALAVPFSKSIAAQFPQNAASFADQVLEQAIAWTDLHAERVCAVLNTLPGLPPKYFRHVAIAGQMHKTETCQAVSATLPDLVRRFPEDARKALDALLGDDHTAAKAIEDILAEDDPAVRGTVHRACKDACLEGLTRNYPDKKPEVSAFLEGRSDAAAIAALGLPQDERFWLSSQVPYVKLFGMDDFAERCVVFQAMVNFDTYTLRFVPGINEDTEGANIWDLLEKYDVPAPQQLAFAVSYSNDQYTKERAAAFLPRLRERRAEIAAADVSRMNVPSRGWRLRLMAEDMPTYADALFATEDGSKVVRAVLNEVLPAPGTGYDDQIAAMLGAKKATRREAAIDLIARTGLTDGLRPAVEAALEKEKSEKLRVKLTGLLGGTVAPTESAPAGSEDLVKSLTKGAKVRKLAWVTEPALPVVHKKDGTEADAVYLSALLLAYADGMPGERSAAADTLAAALDPADLAAFVTEVYGRWMGQGAPAKQKWVLLAAAVHGGADMLDALRAAIKEWSENSRGAIATDAVRAIAMNGSSLYLMAVDAMARKYKNKQVRAAAAKALVDAADAIGITSEELADRIVPDLGFGRDLSRTFDFGSRQFTVYLTPALELEIFEGEKKLKNLPKPGVKDDPEKSAAAVRDFKEMKKQMKAAVQSQRERLEHVLLCERQWTADAWRALFIEKPVMHCFAIGLIWGVYDTNGKLTDTFRYMEDGSFNTVDEDEYTLPDGAMIGLVHPIELDAETLSAWREQLADYEITQPFDQLSRRICTLTDDERGRTVLSRWSDLDLPAMTFLGRMTRAGWDKGYAQDAGMFYEFLRTDIARQEKAADGTLRREGWHAELKFSGMYIGGFYEGMDDVQVEGLTVTRPDHIGKPLPLGEVSPRYLSELLLQIDQAVGSSAPADKEDA